MSEIIEEYGSTIAISLFGLILLFGFIAVLIKIA